jgi:transposase-like protein
MIADPHGLNAPGGGWAKCPVAVTQQVTRRLIPRESISHLSGDPLGGRIAGDADREQGFELILTAKERAMRSQVELHSEAVAKTVREIRRATRRQYSAEEKVRIVIAGLRGEDSIAELCCKEGINQNLYSRWSKDFLEAARNGWPVILRAKRRVTMSKGCARRRSGSSSCWPRRCSSGTTSSSRHRDSRVIGSTCFSNPSRSAGL